MRRSGKAAMLLAVVLALLVWPLACTTTIHPPAAVREPVTVYLADHGRTPSLILPAEPGGLIRYAYGDWHYYALMEQGFLSAARAVLWPSQGTLGRKAMPGPAGVEGIRSGVLVGIEHLYAIEVEADDARALRGRLDAIFDAERDVAVWNGPSDLWFVHHPTRYTYLHNSNHETAGWLRELGCVVRGPAYASRWRLAAPTEQQP